MDKWLRIINDVNKKRNHIILTFLNCYFIKANLLTVKMIDLKGIG